MSSSSSSSSPLFEPMMLSTRSTSDPLSQLSPPRPWYRSRQLLVAAILSALVLIALIAFVANKPKPQAEPPFPPFDPTTSSTSTPPPSSSAAIPPTAPLSPTSTPVTPAPASTSSPPPAAPPTYASFTTVTSYPHPTSCFTQGLAFYKGVLYESCGLYGSSLVRTVNLTSGESIISTSIDRKYFAEGLTILNELVYVLTWEEHVVLVYSLDLKLQSTLPLDSVGWGLTHNGSALIISDGSSTLYYRDPSTMRLLRTVEVVMPSSGGAPSPVRDLNDLEWLDGNVMANVWMTTDVVVVDDSGTVVKVLDGSTQKTAAKGDNYQKVMNGVAWNADTKRLYMTGKSPTHPHPLTHTAQMHSDSQQLVY